MGMSGTCAGIYKYGVNKIEYYWDGNLIGTATFTVQ